MKVEVKLFANFREYLPPASDKYSCWQEMEEGATIGQVLEGLKIPLSIPMIALVNGHHRAFEDRLNRANFLNPFARMPYLEFELRPGFGVRRFRKFLLAGL